MSENLYSLGERVKGIEALLHSTWKQLQNSYPLIQRDFWSGGGSFDYKTFHALKFVVHARLCEQSISISISIGS